MIERLAYWTAEFLAKYIDDTSKFSKIISDRRKKEYKQLTKEEVIDTMAYALQGIYGEIFKLILIFIIASFLHILIPTLIISCVFSIFRMFAGGVHMDTFLTCLSTTTFLFLGGGLLVHNIQLYSNQYINLIIICGEFILNLCLINKYAPRDTPNKLITDIQEITKYKRQSIIYIVIINIILLVFSSYNIFVLSIIFGLLLEVFTIIPRGVFIFNKIELILNKIFNIKVGEDD